MAPGHVKCQAMGCENTRDGGKFVGDFCFPCDQALRSGHAKNGTSWIFELESDLAAAEKQGDAAHAACVEYEVRILMLETLLVQARMPTMGVAINSAPSDAGESNG